MSATIIITTISEPTLERVISAVKNEIPDGQIIVVGYGKTKQIADSHNVSFIDTKSKTPKPIGVNIAVKQAQFDKIIILDADAIPKVGWGKNMLEAFDKGKKIFSGGMDMSEGNFWMKLYNLSGSHEILKENKPEIKKYLPALCLGFTKEVYLKGGKWDESLVKSQDYEWTLRLRQMGFDLWFVPNAVVTHIPTEKTTFMKVMQSWKYSGYYNWMIRNRYSKVLRTPKILSNPLLILVFSPLLAVAPTIRILKTSPKNFFRYFYLLPFVYLTKISWCLGVYMASRKKK